ncbi:MAG: hypothetical protein A2730_03745 [Candidatus Staskawiczbacteria bacterium RIFCSPHIGHO2_01_FULL_39_25]|uniref:DUF7343 domain-containing protein n=1 Tax=Candidatus Staskawiczbacteria bacterium RIFCSPHIGHO2_01_FULL_39_25 TaxID=1802202 RepID=A0A1G2HRP8_9BACT|nr:MAG: hypothetical protein A2730_03745 [Candidatus Staskawiczbacteria bacterium RIFCSPHIGHO2_01_FULL_39_25]
MNQKKTGWILFGASAILLLIFILIIQSLKNQAQELGCFQDAGCLQIENSLSVVHFAFGIFGFLFALAFYLLVFSTGEEAIVQRLERDTNKKLSESKFELFLKGLDDDEKKVVKAVHEQSGITQHTLRLRTNLSKAKVSLIITELERRSIVKRERKNKTFAVFLTDSW